MKENEILREIMRDAKIGWWQADRNRRVFHISEGLRDLLGVCSCEVTYEEFGKMITPAYREYALASIGVRGGAERLYPLQGAEGEIWCYWKLLREEVADDGGMLLTGYFRVVDPPSEVVNSQEKQRINDLLFRLNSISQTLLSLLKVDDLDAVVNKILADALTMYRLDPRDGQMPYCAAIVLGIFFLLRGARRKRRGLRMACRTAASAAQPYLVTLDEGKWNGWDTYAKWSGEPIGFGRQMQAADGAERIFHRVCPLLFIACLLLSVVASIGRGALERLLWCLSAMLTACASLSGALCFALPWLSLTQRLSKSGAAIAGWDGVTATGGSGILLNDTDFFPPGCVSLNGIKIFGDFPVDKVVSDTATLIRDAGCGLDKLFHDLLRAQGCVYRRASDFCVYEGGLSAVIRDQQVLVGSASFMHLMEITLPQGLNVKNAVFCAIDGELAGIFALNYTLHGALEPSLNSLIRNRVTPVMATRDFNLIPAMLRQRFKLPVDKMEFPAVERRRELSDEEQPHSDILTAVLCREGVAPYSEAVVGAALLRRAVRTAAVLACLGAVAGLLLAFYLTFVCSYASLSAANLLVFLLMWLVPTPLIAGMVNKY